MAPWGGKRILTLPRVAAAPTDQNLSGWSDLFSVDYWRGKIAEARAKVSTFIGEFLLLRERLERVRRRATAAAKAAAGNPSAVSRLQQIEREGAALLQQQAQLEGTVASATDKLRTAEEKVREYTGEPQGMGVLPLIPLALGAVIAAAVAAVAIVGAQVYMHKQSVESLENQLGAVERGVLTPEQLAAIRRTESSSGSTWQTALESIPWLLAAGVGMWAFSQARRR